MPIILDNINWMIVNIILAVIPVVLGLLIIQVKHKVIRPFLLIGWLLFIPNTIYLLSDLIHLPPDLGYTSGYHQLIIIGMYKTLVITGIITYVIGIYAIEHAVKKYRKHKIPLLLILNILIAIGLILGRIYRFNSWDVMTKPLSIFITSLQIISTPDYLIFIAFFSFTGTLLYIFLTSKFKKLLLKVVR